jgi:hypothetical protein
MLKLSLRQDRWPWVSGKTKIQPRLGSLGSKTSNLGLTGVSQIHLAIRNKIYPNKVSWLSL